MGKRPSRQAKRTFVLFCEGNTEYNYFKAVNQLPNDIKLITVDMKGGGYKTFLRRIKQEGNFNRLATFIIIDGDRVEKNPGEWGNLLELITYCKKNNKRKGTSPYILIVNCPNFDHIACFHDPNYDGGNAESHIKKVFGYKSLDAFKGDSDIYKKLHEPPRHHINVINKFNSRGKFISNKIKDEKLSISVEATQINEEFLNQCGSNISEIFNIIF